MIAKPCIRCRNTYPSKLTGECNLIVLLHQGGGYKRRKTRYPPPPPKEKVPNTPEPGERCTPSRETLGTLEALLRPLLLPFLLPYGHGGYRRRFGRSGKQPTPCTPSRSLGKPRTTGTLIYGEVWIRRGVDWCCARGLVANRKSGCARAGRGKGMRSHMAVRWRRV